MAAAAVTVIVTKTETAIDSQVDIPMMIACTDRIVTQAIAIQRTDIGQAMDMVRI